MSTQIETTSNIAVRLIQKVGGDHMVVVAARVSTSGEDCLQYADPSRAEEGAAGAVERIFAEGWPLTYKAFCDLGRVAP